MVNLRQQFRLIYGEGKGEKFEKDFLLFKLGYSLGIYEASRIFCTPYGDCGKSLDHWTKIKELDTNG